MRIRAGLKAARIKGITESKLSNDCIRNDNVTDYRKLRVMPVEIYGLNGHLDRVRGPTLLTYVSETLV